MPISQNFKTLQHFLTPAKRFSKNHQIGDLVTNFRAFRFEQYSSSALNVICAKREIFSNLEILKTHTKKHDKLNSKHSTSYRSA